MIAADRGSVEIVNYFLKKDAIVDLVDKVKLVPIIVTLLCLRNLIRTFFCIIFLLKYYLFLFFHNPDAFQTFNIYYVNEILNIDILVL